MSVTRGPSAPCLVAGSGMSGRRPPGTISGRQAEREGRWEADGLEVKFKRVQRPMGKPPTEKRQRLKPFEEILKLYCYS